MERTERLLDLVALLLDARDLVPFAQLREQFPDDYGGTLEAAQRKLERDKAELIQLGVPLEFVEPDQDRELGGYRIDRKSFFLEDPRLQPEEAAALYAAGAAAIASRDFPFALDLGHALKKISLSGSPKSGIGAEPAHAQAGARRLFVVRPGDPSRAGKLKVLGEAVARRKKVHLVYMSQPSLGQQGGLSEERTERDVDPYGLAFRAGAWRLVAHCHLRNALRVFVIDRIEALQVNEARPNQPDFEVPAGFDAGAVAGARPWRWGGNAARTVLLRFAAGAELLAQRAFDQGAELLPGGEARLALEVTWLDGLVPHLLSFGDRVWVEGPEGARRAVRETLQGFAQRLARAPDETVALEAQPTAEPSTPQPASRLSRSKAPPEGAVPADKRERLRRLLLVVPAVRRRPGTKLDELARELGLDASALIQDIDLLSLVGRPPFSPDDLIDISIDEQNRVTVALDQSFSRPPQLTVLEALALSTAAQEAAPADPVVVSALGKLTERLPEAARQLYSALAQRVVSAAPPPLGTATLLATVREAAQKHRELVLEYDKEGRGAVEERVLEPWAVVDHGGRWYLVGRDQLREAMRTFRADRVRAVRATGRTFADPGPLDASLFDRAEMFFPGGAERPVTLRFSPATAAWARSRWGAKARTLANGCVELELEAAGNAYAVSLALSFAGEAEIVRPRGAREALREEVQRTLARYGDGGVRG